MEEKTLQEKDLKAFLITYYLTGLDNPQSIIIIAFTKKEAGDFFIKWYCDKKMSVDGLIVKTMRKNKRNAYYYTLERYNRQRRLLYEFNSDLNALFEAERVEELEKDLTLPQRKIKLKEKAGA